MQRLRAPPHGGGGAGVARRAAAAARGRATCRCARPRAACWRRRSSATVDVPGFDRATMDGYAVVADDTEGADAVQPHAADGRRRRDAGPAVRTAPSRGAGGAHHDRRADAARAPMRCCRPSGSKSEAGLRPHGHQRTSPPVSPGKNVGRRGEDIVAGTTVLEAGRVLRPQDVGVLSSIGHRRRSTSCAGRACGWSSPATSCCRPGSQPRDFRITDANGPMLAALAERDGGVVDFPGLVPRRAGAILDGAARRRRRRDRVGRIERRHRGPGADARRASTASWRFTASRCVRAARPAWAASAIGWCSCCPAIRCRPLRLRLLRRPRDSRARRPPARRGRTVRCAARLTRKISSPIGRLDYARVRLVGWRTVEPLAVGGASVLSSTTRADGFVIVGDDSEGFRGRRGRRRLALCVSRSSSSRSSIATRPSAASAPRSISRRAARDGSARRGARARARRRRRVAGGRAVVRSLERGRLRGRGRGHVRRVRRSAATRAPRRRGDPHRRRAGDVVQPRRRASRSPPAA